MLAKGLTAKLFLLALVLVFVFAAVTLIRRLRNPVEYTIDEHGIQIDSPRPSEQNYVPWSSLESSTLEVTRYRGVSFARIVLNVFSDPPMRYPTLPVVLSFSNSYSARRAEAVAGMLHQLHARAMRTRIIERPRELPGPMDEPPTEERTR